MPSRLRRASRTRAPAPTLRVEVVTAAPASSRGASAGLAAWLCGVAPRRAAGEVAVLITTDARVRALNRRYRGHDRVTDVLSFPGLQRTSSPVLDSRFTVLGDIVIAVGRARRQAHEAGHSLAAELRVLALHGLLHLLGFDHETDDGAMERIEGVLRRKGGLRAGLIDRAHPKRKRTRPRRAGGCR